MLWEIMLRKEVYINSQKATTSYIGISLPGIRQLSPQGFPIDVHPMMQWKVRESNHSCIHHIYPINMPMA